MVGLLSLILIAVGATAGRQTAGSGGEQALQLVTFPGAYTLILSFLLGLGGLFAVIYGAAVAGSAWTWGTLKSAVARGESRSRYQLVTQRPEVEHAAQEDHGLEPAARAGHVLTA